MKTYESFKSKGKRDKDTQKNKEHKEQSNSIKDTFLKLTEYTHPFGLEYKLLPLLPDGLIEDEVGNYYMTIGESETLFSCHIDNSCYKMEKVNHVFKGNFIHSDGTTILGSDDKAGVVVLMYLINHKIPGTYYFFVGEERGRWGSENIFKEKPDFFKKFKRCVAFDRKSYGSVITNQMCQVTCSDNFANALIGELGKSNMKYRIDTTGSYTDSYSFVEMIPECTNLSNGGFDEHTHHERLDINFLERLCKAVVEVDWESLPSERDPSTVEYDYGYAWEPPVRPSGYTYTHSVQPNWWNEYDQTKREQELADKGYPDDYEEYVKGLSVDVFDREDEGYPKRFNTINAWNMYYTVRNYIKLTHFDNDEKLFDDESDYVLSRSEIEHLCHALGTDVETLKDELYRMDFLRVRGDNFVFNASEYY